MATTSRKTQHQAAVVEHDYYNHMKKQPHSGGPSPPQQSPEHYQIPPKRSAYADGSPTTESPPSAGGISPSHGAHAHYDHRRQYRQIRPQRQPLYIPAALRPTELSPRSKPTDIPSRPRAPDTPPASKDSSFDSFKSSGAPSSASSSTGFQPSNLSRSLSLSGTISSFDSLPPGVERACTEGCLDMELDIIRGPPTTAHWKPDSTSEHCLVCRKPFTWFARRHHCRRCGHLVCSIDSMATVPLDHNARFHPDGQESRACDPCVADWKIVRELREERANSLAAANEENQDNVSQDGSGNTITAGMAIPRSGSNGAENNATPVGSMARSAGFVWSTF